MNEMFSELKNREGFRRYFANTSWLLAEKILRTIVLFIVWVFVIRYLRAEKFGLFTYSLSFVGLFAAISAMTADGILVRELVRQPENKHNLLGTAFVLRVIGSAFAICVLATCTIFTNDDFSTNILIFIIAAGLLFQSWNVIDCYFQSQVLSKYVVYVHIFQIVISSALKLMFIYLKLSLVWFAVVALGDSVILAGGQLWFYLRREGSIRLWRFDRTLAMSLFKDSWPLLLSSLVIGIYMKIDQVMIKQMLSAEATGSYGVAVRLSEAWYFIPMVITSSLFPAIVNAKQTSKQLYYERLQKLCNFMVWLSLCIAVPTTFLARPLVVLIFGKEFSAGGPALAIHIWSGVFVFLGFVNGKWILAENLGKTAFLRSLLGAITNIILNLLLIPKMGITGSAIATLVAVSISAHFFFIFQTKTRPLFNIQTKALLLIGNLKAAR